MLVYKISNIQTQHGNGHWWTIFIKLLQSYNIKSVEIIKYKMLQNGQTLWGFITWLNDFVAHGGLFDLDL